MPEILPRALANRRDVQLLDVRLREELQPPFGYIPGARHVPGPIIELRPESLLETFPSRPALALYCMSGRRSLELLERVEGLGFPEVYSLSGGLLGWLGAGLPVTGGEPNLPSQSPVSVEACHRALRSCFVAATVETALDGVDVGLEDHPGITLEAVMEQVRPEARSERELLLLALDRLAEVAWRRGHALDRIAGNMDHMRSVLAALAS